MACPYGCRDLKGLEEGKERKVKNDLQRISAKKMPKYFTVDVTYFFVF
jgi:hypothetical protein